MHLTICADSGQPFEDAPLARMVCLAAEKICDDLGFVLYAYCLMPDHMHLLLSPGQSQTELSDFLRRFKSFTTRQYQKRTGVARLWQYSARDRVLRKNEDPLSVGAYIANNPVRRGLVACWTDWPYSRIFMEPSEERPPLSAHGRRTRRSGATSAQRQSSGVAAKRTGRLRED